MNDTPRFEEPDLSPDEGWSEVTIVQKLAGLRSFVSDNHPDDDRLRVRYFVREEDGQIVGRAWFGPGAEGPPGYAHGGSSAAVLDEALGAAAWAAGHSVLTGELKVKYLRPLPLGQVVTFETWIADVQGRRVVARGHIVDGEGEPYSKGEVTFVELDTERAGQAHDIVEKLFRGKGGGG